MLLNQKQVSSFSAVPEFFIGSFFKPWMWKFKKNKNIRFSTLDF